MRLTVSTCALILMAWGTTAAAITDAERCEAAKTKIAGSYAFCRQKAQGKAIKTGTAADYAKCDAKYAERWTKAETNGGVMCPSNGDLAAIQEFITAHTDSLEAALAGGVLPGQAQLLKTGQVDCYDSGGLVVACAGTGQDGELQRGATRQYVDNGDGTVTDEMTRLIWEKKSDDGGIHDMHTTYTWTGALSFIASLNSGGGFAGHTDWRLPNIIELQSVATYGSSSDPLCVNPPVEAVFDTSCAPGCTVMTCSCTEYSYYWSSTSYTDFPDEGWSVLFFCGAHLQSQPKTGTYHVRAVRGGS